jgi:hypothetical protein
MSECLRRDSKRLLPMGQNPAKSSNTDDVEANFGHVAGTTEPAERYRLARRYSFRLNFQCPTKPLLHRLALHPATTAKLPNLLLRGYYCAGSYLSHDLAGMTKVVRIAAKIMRIHSSSFLIIPHH